MTLRYTEQDLGGPWDWELVPDVVMNVLGPQNGTYYIRGSDDFIEIVGESLDESEASIRTALQAHSAAGSAAWEDSKKQKTSQLTNGRALLRAVALVFLDEVNLLRSQHSLPERTPAQLKNAIKSKL